MVPPAHGRAIVHVDMDAFYASVEQRDRPELRGKPVIVGADPRGRGVVSAASYEARRFGVHSAMPISRAARLCPQAVFLAVDMEKYARVSKEIMAILAEYSPLIEPLSLDEAFLDVTGSERLSGPPLELARTIKRRIREEVGLTASAGVAPNKFLAKLASDLEKPDGLVEVRPGEEATFLHPLPVERLWGVGRVTAAALRRMGIETIGQLARVPVGVLERRFGKTGSHLHELAWGRDDRPVEPWAPPKSMGAEETFPNDHRDVGRLELTLRAQAERVARELRDDGYSGRTVTLKLRFRDFRTLTRSHTGEPTQDGLEIYCRARSLLGRVPLTQPVRLIGLSVSGLAARDSGQLDLFAEPAARRARLAGAVDTLARRFGEGTVIPATLVSRRR
ncbi:MAG: DNA polymerase IV [Candidatus Rokubacteria bacterium]|nr:DNA polymerase IV [Candidatus Rokubacteria bacterium]